MSQRSKPEDEKKWTGWDIATAILGVLILISLVMNGVPWLYNNIFHFSEMQAQRDKENTERENRRIMRAIAETKLRCEINQCNRGALCDFNCNLVE
ncbi:hypothetical protein [Dongia sp.]|uniref:hypothetical protein n=1 Tax=Dongia sp. TaxID=1977262 RepID=UPI0035B02ABB